jgi:hypothetical protein
MGIIKLTVYAHRETRVCPLNRCKPLRPPTHYTAHRLGLAAIIVPYLPPLANPLVS